ncbi:hypothetical protein P5673_025693 [Acropora cervicornis]|uniref:Uncharacterized protein n=1 Tax=Acropora cervicornis TaxID=6130 RepID=A0AAD9Q262_ACRCE|nr:hypothetical protein P5673_025693 [Acropora cervicornis]
MTSHSVPSRPWQVLAVDLFELQGQDYLNCTCSHTTADTSSAPDPYSPVHALAEYLIQPLAAIDETDSSVI